MLSHERLITLMRRAYELASKSPDPSSQNGAVVTCETGQVIGEGVNHLYRGFGCDLNNRDLKLQCIEHAERDAIYDMATRGEPCNTRVMVCPWAACMECARAIVGTGIERLVVHGPRMDLTPERWKSNVDDALRRMSLAGCQIDFLYTSIDGAPDILVSGRLWSPESCEFTVPV